MMLNASKIHAATRQFERAYAIVMRPLSDALGMPQTAADILMFLSNNPEMNSAVDICACRGLKPSNVSFHVEQLVREGYLVRSNAPNDRRRCRLQCTEKAQPLIERGHALQEEFYQRMMQGIPPEDFSAMQRCLKIMEENLQRIKE